MCENLELHLSLRPKIQCEILSDGPLNLTFQLVHGQWRMNRGTRSPYIYCLNTTM